MNHEGTLKLVRLQLAAQSDLDATTKAFEAAVLREDQREQEALRARAHAHLDSLLDLKMEVIAAAHASNLRKL